MQRAGPPNDDLDVDLAAAERAMPPAPPALLGQVPALVWVTDRELRFTAVHGGHAHPIGMHLVLGRNLADYFPPESDAVRGHLRATEGEAARYLVGAAGRSWSVVVEPLREAGEIVGCVAVAVDATRDGDREQQLVEANETLRVLTENVPVVVYTATLDAAERPRFISSSVEELLGVPAHAFTFQLLRDAIHPDDRERVHALQEDADRDAADLYVEYRIVRADGGERWIEDSSNVVRVAGQWLAQGYLLDVTERKRTEALLRRRARTRRSLTEVARQAVAGAEVAQLVEAVLPILREGIEAEFGAYLEVDGEELVVRECFGWSCVGAVAAPSSPAGRAFATAELVTTDGYDAPEGSARAQAGIRSTIAAPVVAGGRVHAVFAVHARCPDRFDGNDADLVDHAASLVAAAVSRQDAERERHAMEQELLHAHRLEAIGQLAAGVAHDFNNLLTAVSGYTELARRAVDDERVAAYLDEVLGASGRARDLTAQLLAFSRKQRLEPRQVDANELVRALQPMVGPLVGKSVSLELDLADGALEVFVDPGRLESVLLNLSANARDAMARGGRLCFRTGATELAEEEARELDVSAGRFVTIAVADTGVGIPPELLGRIFEPFFTTKEVGEGTGLGLSSVYGTVRQSGGFVRVASEPGAGSTFELGFPAV